MYEEIGAKDLRQDLRRVLDAIQIDKRRVMILRNGEAVAALIPPEELRALERADGSRMAYHEQKAQAQLREISWLKEGLDGSRHEALTKDD